MGVVGAVMVILYQNLPIGREYGNSVSKITHQQESSMSKVLALRERSGYAVKDSSRGGSSPSTGGSSALLFCWARDAKVNSMRDGRGLLLTTPLSRTPE